MTVPLSTTATGLRLTGNVKALAPLQLAGRRRAIVAANNDGPLQVVVLNDR